MVNGAEHKDNMLFVRGFGALFGLREMSYEGFGDVGKG